MLVGRATSRTMIMREMATGTSLTISTTWNTIWSMKKAGQNTATRIAPWLSTPWAGTCRWMIPPHDGWMVGILHEENAMVIDDKGWDMEWTIGKNGIVQAATIRDKTHSARRPWDTPQRPAVSCPPNHLSGSKPASQVFLRALPGHAALNFVKINNSHFHLFL